jgi:pyruvate/2-oxoglutarate dehydrogenase complex dihydrolipoamide acyltransferase (E2) component
MPGSVISIAARAGQAVERGQVLMVIESMKMETPICAPFDGTLEALHADVGQTFERDAPLATIEPDGVGPHEAHRLDPERARRRLRRQPGAQRAARARAPRDAGPRAHTTGPSATCSAWRARASCSCASACGCCSTRARRSSSCPRSPPTRTTTARCPAPRRDRHRRRVRAGGLIHADDASVKGGAWYPLSVKKIVRATDVAIENRLPMVHLCDSAGGFLPLQADLFPDRHNAGGCSATSRSCRRWACRRWRGARPLHRRRRVRAGAVRLQRDRAGHAARSSSAARRS